MFFIYLLVSASANPDLFGDGSPNRRPAPSKYQKDPVVFDSMLLYTIEPDSELSHSFLALKKDPSLSKIKFKLIDCIENKYYCEDKNITIFPTVKYQTPKESFDYSWDHSISDYTVFAKKMHSPAVTQINDPDYLLDFITEHPVSFILYANQFMLKISAPAYIDDYSKLAHSLKNTSIYFAIAFTDEVSYINGVEYYDMPILLQLGVDFAYSYNISGDLSMENMRKFVTSYKCTMKHEVTNSNWAQSLECFNDKVVGFVFLGTEQSGPLNPDHLSLLAKEYREKHERRFQFAYVNITAYPEFGKKFSIEKTPCFMIIDYRETPRPWKFEIFDLRKFASIKYLFEKVWNRESLSDFTDQEQINEKARSEDL